MRPISRLLLSSTSVVGLAFAFSACSQTAAPNSNSGLSNVPQVARTNATMHHSAMAGAQQASDPTTLSQQMATNLTPSGNWIFLLPIPDDPDDVMFPDGEIISLPPPDDEIVTPDLSCKFNGNVPPPCTNTGPFHRLYSSPTVSYIEAQFTSPAQQSQWPSGPYGYSTGYAYIEGWPLPVPSNNTEAGFLRSALNNWYTAYMSIPGQSGGWYEQSVYFQAGSILSVTLQGRDAATCPNTSKPCVTGNFGGTCDTRSPQCHGLVNTAPDNGWGTTSCCVMASMISIAQKHGQDLANQDVFGPIFQEVATSKTASTCCGGWGSGIAGTQIHPNNATKVIVSKTSLGVEHVTINLHT